MSNRYDDDDLQDYAQGDYTDEEQYDNQDDIEMTEEEEAKMYELAPLVMEQLEDYKGFTEQDVLRTLYNNYNDLNDTVAEMKSKFELNILFDMGFMLLTETLMSFNRNLQEETSGTKAEIGFKIKQ
ncbi:hypothetical protein WICPIJ_003432 [Wickerhamomyces pijperi]|uniref:HBS1-like protein N-terminal domain-containing protein n=1 Tax=Wickerhamomyces pijperi TaxID=599730 RepID=A0A9P8Q9P2_WICPI|nr:hypothetical protein WICPIJ_003432 [Wickerhamomyces pijperi]